jgi:hypothetical protein
MVIFGWPFLLCRPICGRIESNRHEFSRLRSHQSLSCSHRFNHFSFIRRTIRRIPTNAKIPVFSLAPWFAEFAEFQPTDYDAAAWLRPEFGSPSYRSSNTESRSRSARTVAWSGSSLPLSAMLRLTDFNTISQRSNLVTTCSFKPWISAPGLFSSTESTTEFSASIS